MKFKHWKAEIVYRDEYYIRKKWGRESAKSRGEVAIENLPHWILWQLTLVKTYICYYERKN